MIPHFSAADKQPHRLTSNTRKQAQCLARTLTDQYLIFMLLVFPLFTGVSGYRSITVSKYFCFVLPTALWLLSLLCCRIRAGNRWTLSRLSAAQKAVLLFGATACLSACCSEFRAQTLIGTSRYDGLLTLLLYCGVFLGISQYGEFRRHHAIALAVSTTICCAIAVLQLFCYNPLALFHNRLTYYDGGTLYSSKFLGTIGNTNLLAAFLCIGTPFFTALYITDDRAHRGFWLLPAALGLFVLVRSGSSGGLVALGLGALIAVPVVLQTKNRLCRAFRAAAFLSIVAACACAMTPHYRFGAVRFSIEANLRTLFCFAASAACMILHAVISRAAPCAPRRQGQILACCCICVVLLGLAFVYWYPAESGSLYELSRILHGDISDSFGSNRIRIWRAVLDLVPAHPLLGGGPDTLAARLDLTFSRLVEETGATLVTRVDNAHNEYLGHLANLGALGLGAYLIAMAASLRTWFRQCNTVVSAAIGCAVLCYWLEGLFGLGLVLTNPLLWTFWALLETESIPRHL